jgi:FAD/FMN-containing dehydrogenase
MTRRRDFLKLGCAFALAPAANGCAPRAPRTPVSRARAPVVAMRRGGGGVYLNDVHSQLNRTHVAEVARPASVEELRAVILRARDAGKALSVAGGRHSMGGQQFGTDTVSLDMRGMNRVLRFDEERGILEVEAGIEWPELLAFLWGSQAGRAEQWGIVQKQTGADKLSLGGALASNVHGRGLRFKPIVGDVESFTLVDAAGEARRCSREENAELFRLAVGGYGLFGVVTSVELRLRRRQKVERVVELRDVDSIPDGFAQRIADGYLYGDFQYATDSGRDSFLRKGVFSCYRPVDPGTRVTSNPTRFHPEDWARLVYYGHTHKRRAFEAYSKRYLATSGQIYWSDSQLSAAYIEDYHAEVDRKMHVKTKATEMITEIYVPRASLLAFLADARRELRDRDANLIYGTIRLIERDDETFLRWAKEPYACVIFNLHVTHDPAAIDKAAEAFRGLIDIGIHYGGSYYLTYHRYATGEQVRACYPQFAEFLALKRKYDPDEAIQSDWYRHYRSLFA